MPRAPCNLLTIERQSGMISRSRDDRVVAGVIGGLADHLGWSATQLRIVYVVVSVLSAAFPGLIVYAILWFLMPGEPAP